MTIKDIENEIRNGKLSAEDIISEVERIQTVIKEEEKKKQSRQVMQARAKAIAGLIDYMRVLNLGPKDEKEEMELAQTFEDGFKELELIVADIKPVKKRTSQKKEVSDKEMNDYLDKIFKLYLK